MAKKKPAPKKAPEIGLKEMPTVADGPSPAEVEIVEPPLSEAIDVEAEDEKAAAAKDDGEAAEDSGEPRWLVSLNCPTPLAHPSLEVQAGSEQEAREMFCVANGICDSSHPWKVERLY